MPGKEYIKVYIDFQDGKAVCICPKDKKKCGKQCSEDVVVRDKYLGWEKTINRTKFGR